MRAIYYTYIFPENGYQKKLLNLFSPNKSRLVLNAEVAIDFICKNIPGREPGMIVAIDEKNAPRFKKIVQKNGLKPSIYVTQKQRQALFADERVCAIITSDASIKKKKDTKANVPIIFFAHRKNPLQQDGAVDMYIWQPKMLPPSSGGAVISFSPHHAPLYSELGEYLGSLDRFEKNEFIREIWYWVRGYENKYRRLDRRPAKILARLLYDEVK